MTAKTDLELANQVLTLDDEEFEESYYFYDDIDNYHQLRQERGDMPNAKHNNLVDYLKQVLLWLYRLEGYQVNREINFYETDDRMEKPLYPDIFVLKSSEEFPQERGYRLGVDGPAPQVIIEVISKKTARVDLKEKPKLYEGWGVIEYFAYDPRKRVRKTEKARLTGWRLVEGKYQILKPDENGWMWSEQLDSWLAPDDNFLYLYDRDKHQQRLTAAQAYFEETQVAIQREATERRAKEVERQAKEAALRRESVEREAKEAALLHLERLAQKLRQLGEDPDKL
jgi:Uma2 family endonuclease